VGVPTQMRGGSFYANRHGIYYPSRSSMDIAKQAITDVAAAMGVDEETYFVLLEWEGPEILKRLPGVTP
jgi:hypothetical protein